MAAQTPFQRSQYPAKVRQARSRKLARLRGKSARSTGQTKAFEGVVAMAPPPKRKT